MNRYKQLLAFILRYIHLKKEYYYGYGSISVGQKIDDPGLIAKKLRLLRKKSIIQNKHRGSRTHYLGVMT